MSPGSAALQAFPIGHEIPHSHPEDLIDPSQFADFDFGYGGIPDGQVISLQDGRGADMFGTQPQPQTMVQERHNSAIVMNGGRAPTFNVSAVSARRASFEASEDGSENSRHRILNPLDDAMSDEFGMSSTGAGDGTDLGGKPKEDKSETIPPWSELKTKAGKERKRLPLACIACRRKKIRCSGEKPACKHCLRSRIPCVYKVTTRKAAPRTDYMAMLDKRLKRMEERIIKIIPKSEQEAASSSVTRAVVKPAIPGTISANKSSKKKQSEENDLDQWATRSQSKTRLDGKSNKIASLHFHEVEDNKLLTEGSKALPDKEIQEHLANVFFENIYGQAYHLLHKPSYMRKLKNGTLPPVLILSVCAVAARFSTHPKFGATANFLRGEEWAREARDIVTRRYEWPNITILTCLLILGLHEFGTCQGGRSWALGGQATRMAFALQLHKDLEFDPASLDGTAPLSFIDKEIRRRTMWACFLMDRFNSSGTDRPMFIREETVKIPLPIKEKYFQLDMPGPTETLDGQVLNPVSADDGQLADAKENMGVAAYMIRAIALWGRIISYLNQGGREADPQPFWCPDSLFSKLIAEADDFPKTLPESLLFNEDNLRLHETENMANQFLFLHISIQQNILFINRHAMSLLELAATSETPESLFEKVQESAFATANRISELLQDAENMLVTAPFVGYCAFLSSTVHIMGLYSKGGGNSQLAEKQKKNLAVNIKYLGKMKRYWGMFHWIVENLREQYKTYHDTTRTSPPETNLGPAVGAPGSGSVDGADSPSGTVAAQSPVFQYGDWFDRYPHGLSHTDYVDPAAVPKKKERGHDAVLEQKPELHTVEEYFTTLSPPQTGDMRAMNDRRNAANLKRKAQLLHGGPQSKKTREEQQLGSLMTDLGNHPQAHHDAQQQASLRGFALGGQTSGPTNFHPLTIPHTTAGAGYHALSPISPVVGHSNNHLFSLANVQDHALEHFPVELIHAIQQSANMPSGVGNLERHLDFGGFGGHDVQSGHHSAGVLDGSGQGHGGGPAGPWGHMPSRRNTAGGLGGRHPAMAGFVDSSAWFSPFNMDTEVVNHDIMGNNSMDGFLFGTNGNGSGLATPGGMGLHNGR
ncbi:hypothetical protein MKZ38_006503 [Zalerion maritima]|uniref:Zn(2)-C6 fungal-type domain-containing protein n=1 Tax=Zalerion maritima TaxID=339359 RepID=A0AAD5WVI4_9PEZI|nr:hypothetical protein MKZ38_006503 [Zalerion maritima]